MLRILGAAILFIYSFSAFSSCEVQGLSTRQLNRFHDKCDSFGGVAETLNVTSKDECDNYNESKCSKFVIRSFPESVNSESSVKYDEQMKQAAKDTINSIVNVLVDDISAAAGRLDSNLVNLNRCSLQSLGLINKTCLTNMKKRLGIDPAIISEDIKKQIELNQIEANKNGEKCIQFLNFTSFQSLSAEKSLDSKLKVFMDSSKGTEFINLIQKTEQKDLKKATQEFFASLPNSREFIKLKKAMEDSGEFFSSAKHRVLLNNKKMLEGYLTDFKDPAGLADSWAKELNLSCDKAFAALEDFICKIPEKGSYSLENRELTSNFGIKSDIPETHFYCSKGNFVSSKKIEESFRIEDLKTFGASSAVIQDVYKDTVNDVCKIFDPCKEGEEISCWKNGCSKETLTQNQANYCSVIGKKDPKSNKFEIADKNIVEMLKGDQKTNSSSQYGSELMKFFLDPNPGTVGTYVANAEKNSKENQKIIKSNGGGNYISDNVEAEPQSTTTTSQTTNNFVPNYGKSTASSNYDSSRSKTLNPVTNNSGVNVATNNSGENVEDESLLDARNSLMNRLKNTNKQAANDLNRKKKENSNVQNFDNNSNQGPTNNSPTVVNAGGNQEKSPVTNTNASPFNGAARSPSSTSGLFDGNTKDAVSKVASSFKDDGYAKDAQGKEFLKVSLEVDSVYIKNVQILEKAILDKYSDELQNRKDIELTLVLPSPQKPVKLYLKHQESGDEHYYLASSTSPDAAELVQKLNDSKSIRIVKSNSTNTNRVPSARVEQLNSSTP